MNGSFALSLSHSVTEVGAIAAFAALLGIAILSLLVFSQAREIKRLREWAGRSPERAAEMEQRVSADAAARVRGGAPPAPVGARVVPRKTPLVSAPVSTAVNATVAAVVPAAGSPGPRQVQAGPVGEVPAVTAAASGAAAVAGAPSGDSSPQAANPTTPAPSTANPVAPPLSTAGPVASDPSAANPAAPISPNAVPAVQSGAVPGQSEKPAKEAAVDSPAPVTAAARAANASGRAPLPPSPTAPAPPAGVPAPTGSTSGAASAALAAGAGAGAAAVAPEPASRPSVPAARSMPSRTVSAPAGSSPPRAPTPSRARPISSAATSAGALAGTRAPGAPVGGNGPKYFKPERSPRRATALIVGVAIVGVLVIVLAISVLKGGGSTPKTSSAPPVSETPTTSSHTTASAVASNPSETAVVVLNGTGTPELAHHLAADLQQGGYTLAAASTGVPPGGTHATTVVQYTHGHRADAKAVAKALNVTQVQPIESAIASLAGSATVVVLAGADQASQLGGTQSNGEPAATGGEGAAGGQ